MYPFLPSVVVNCEHRAEGRDKLEGGQDHGGAAVEADVLENRVGVVQHARLARDLLVRVPGDHEKGVFKT